MSKKVIIALADGFEETEAVVPADILKRAEIEVVLAGIGSDSVTGAHGIVFRADTVFRGYDDSVDAIILPGGMPGAENLAGSAELKRALIRMNAEKRIVAAICASPAVVLSPAGLLNGRKATCYPGMEKSFPLEVEHSRESVVTDGNIITSQGPATAFDFGLKIAFELAGEAKAAMVAEHMLYSGT
jgi:4-methyl-5(b-hydroxyethyl)-thiazole monophosphate biosynthesis